MLVVGNAEVRLPSPTDLTPDQYAVFVDYGEALAKGDVRVKTLARLLGVTEWTVRQAQAYALWEYAKREEPPVKRPPPPNQGARVLVVGDAHAKPNQDLSRFAILGRVIEREARDAKDLGVPFHVVVIGDWADMESLSSYDKGKRSFEGRRYTSDVAAANEALRLTRRNCAPDAWEYAQKHVTLGNHEHRIMRATNDLSELDGLIHTDDLEFAAYGFNVLPFLQPLWLNGVGFCHYFASGAMGRPVSGVNLGRSLILKTLESVVVGHNHMLDFYTLTTAAGRRMCALSAGCYFEHDEDYAGQANAMFWRGLVMLDDVRDGHFDVRTFTLQALRREYADALV